MKWHQPPTRRDDPVTRNNNRSRPVTILAVQENGEKVCLQICFNPEFYKELDEFLSKKGYVNNGNDNAGIPLLLEFGLSGESREDLEKIKQEMLQSSSHNAAMSFRTAQYYSSNQAIAIGLTVHLSENKRLKEELKERGLGHQITENEWDSWDQKYINDLYQKYVFGK